MSRVSSGRLTAIQLASYGAGPGHPAVNRLKRPPPIAELPSAVPCAPDPLNDAHDSQRRTCLRLQRGVDTGQGIDPVARTTPTSGLEHLLGEPRVRQSAVRPGHPPPDVLGDRSATESRLLACRVGGWPGLPTGCVGDAGLSFGRGIRGPWSVAGDWRSGCCRGCRVEGTCFVSDADRAPESDGAHC